jgi:radical SAM protein with 4Fe4S-binding SPASM domain
MSNCKFENIGWTVGNHCNARCGHCYSWKVRKDSREFLTEEDVDQVIQQLQRLGIKTVNLGGNEPIYTHGDDLSRTILPYIIRELTNADIPVGLTTNGISFKYLEQHYPEELKMINDIDFSLDSPFQKEHDFNRGVKLYKTTISAIQRSIELGIDCSIIACGMRQNFTKEYLSAYLALTKLIDCEFRINTLKPIEPSLKSEMPSREQFYEGFSFLMNNSHCITLGESCLSAFAQNGSEGCPCGTSSFRINAKTSDGKIPINPCVYMHDFKTGNLLEDDIFDIIESPEFKAFANRKKSIPQSCRESGCSYIEKCRGGCSARSFLIHNDLESKDPYCPQEYFNQQGQEPNIPKYPVIGCSDGIRVHDNYLCTWIGKVNHCFADERYDSLENFLDNIGDHQTKHISGCKQVQNSNSQESLIRTDLI